MGILYTPTSLEKGLRSVFFQTMAALPPSLVGKIATVVPSGANNEKYAWLGQPPQMEELTDEVKFSPMSDTSYTVTNKTFASGIAVRRETLSDDQVGGVEMRVRQLAEVAKFHPDKLLIDALTGGTTDTCYDGVAFFSATHPVRNKESAAQSNLLSGSGTTTANVQTDIAAAIAALMNFQGENGEPFNLGGLQELTIIAPPAMIKPIYEALNAQIISNTSNVAYSSFKINVELNARLTATSVNDWYVLNTGAAVRPLLFQDREPLEFAALEKDNGDAAFSREVYKYKARARYNVGYSFWQNAIKINN